MWALALHGGATEVEPNEEAAYRSGCLAALAAGRAVLVAGGTAVDAVVAAVRVLEDDPTFNAGTGSARRADGRVEMCSGVMDGRTLEVGGVSIIEGVRNPILVAQALSAGARDPGRRRGGDPFRAGTGTRGRAAPQARGPGRRARP